jgi:exonuclease SbcC
MLSLFLSATLTQNWSSFETILLDDPVTHFDDMNTYSLIDLVKGMLYESCCPRQLIISTCEVGFFRLLRQRFPSRSGEAIFYSFETIGRDGPTVRRLE